MKIRSRMACVSLAVLPVLAASVVLAEGDNVIRQPTVAVQDEAKSAEDLRKELDQTRKDAEAARQQAAQAEEQARQAKEAAARAQQPAPPPPAPAPAAPVVIYPYPGTYLGISRMHISTDKKDGEWTADVTCSITLNRVPHVPFTYQAILVTADGTPVTDIRGQQFTGAREVSTGEDADTDRYTARINLGGLFTSRPPTDLYVQARLVDSSGRVVAVSSPQYFVAPR